ncbi:MAG: catalase [Acidimicrobiia bacterium]|nr:catalase [Acidimicrobiia bacterium]
MGTLPLRPGGEVRSPARLVVDSADRLVNTTHRSAGDYTPANERERPVHRRGFAVQGRFTASGALTPYTRTPALAAGASQATVRFSNFKRDDWERMTDVRGMACRLVSIARAADDQDTRGRSLDLVAMTAPRFIVRREEDFHEVAPRRQGWGRLRLPWFILTRRTTVTAVAALLWHTRLRPPGWHLDLANRKYFGVHTFWLEKAGEYRAMRYHWRPATRRSPGTGDLDEALTNMLPIAFDLIVDLFDEDVPYRKTNDPLRRYPNVLREVWPISRRPRVQGTQRLVAGRLELSERLTADHPANTDWVFNPVPAIGGFEASDDEILEARGGAYLASHVRRSPP